jgi:hypothetical protein
VKGLFLVGVVAAAGCEVLFPLAPGPDAPVDPADAAADAGPPDANLGPFTSGERIAIEPAPAQGFYDTDLSLVGDESQLAFSRYSLTVADTGDVRVATRGVGPLDWLDAQVTTFSVAGRTDGTPKLSPDGTVIWIAATAMGQPANIEAHRRASPTALAWMNATASDATGLNTALDDKPSTPTGPLDRTIVARDGALIEYARLSGMGPWTAVQPPTLAAVNALGAVANPQLSADGTTLVFVLVAGGVQNDIYLSSRPAPDQPFAAPAPISEVNTPDNEGDPWLSADRRRLWFSRNGGTLLPAQWGIYHAFR